MKINLSAVLVVFISLIGCAESPRHTVEIPRHTEADAATWGDRFDDESMCKLIGEIIHLDVNTLSNENKEAAIHNRNLYIKEIERRKLITKKEWQRIKEKKITIGMSQCALYASWGAPAKENRSVGRWGVHIQHMYGDSPDWRYVYTENGKITSWQD